MLADVGATIADLLPAFTLPALLGSCRLGRVPLILGARRERWMFPIVHRLAIAPLTDWEARTTVDINADEALAATFDPACRHHKPYLVLPTSGFAGEIAEAIRAIEARLGLRAGMALLWIGSGGHVTPLHHDGEMVDRRWHLVVRGAKRFDLLPPDARCTAPMPWWSLHHRFSYFYDGTPPEGWFEPPIKGECHFLAAGQMLSWPRKWWHRVEIGPDDTTIALSTRAHGRSAPPWRHVRHWIKENVIGDVEATLERQAIERPIMSLDALRVAPD